MNTINISKNIYEVTHRENAVGKGWNFMKVPLKYVFMWEILAGEIYRRKVTIVSKARPFNYGSAVIFIIKK